MRDKVSRADSSSNYTFSELLSGRRTASEEFFSGGDLSLDVDLTHLRGNVIDVDVASHSRPLDVCLP